MGRSPTSRRIDRRNQREGARSRQHAATRQTDERLPESPIKRGKEYMTYGVKRIAHSTANNGDGHRGFGGIDRTAEPRTHSRARPNTRDPNPLSLQRRVSELRRGPKKTPLVQAERRRLTLRYTPQAACTSLNPTTDRITARRL